MDGELLEFAHTDALAALQAITTRRPRIVALERLFAMTSRGAALINRIKADPSLVAVEIRVIAHDNDYSRIVPRAKPPTAAPALDNTGTRRAPRFKMAGRVDVLIDGKTALLVDLSTVGAQVISPAALRPNQEIAMVLPDGGGPVRFNAKVAWTAFVTSPDGAARYRAGVDFLDANAAEVDAFLQPRKA